MTDVKALNLELSPGAQRLWLLLASFRHYLKLVPTVSELAAYMGTDGDTVRRLYGELERKGYLFTDIREARIVLFVWPPLAQLYNPAGWRRQRCWRRMRKAPKL